MMPLAWYDVALIALIAVFMWSKAFLLDRQSALGLAMSWANIALGSSYVWRLVQHYFPQTPYLQEALTVIRIAVMVAVLWCLVLLVGGRWRIVREAKIKLINAIYRDGGP